MTLKPFLLLLTTVFIAFPCLSQTVQDNLESNRLEEFEVVFEEALEEDFTEEALDQLFQEYSLFLTPYSKVTQIANVRPQGAEIHYPLHFFQQKPLYQNNIGSLFNSSNKNHRLLAYLVIASSGDTSFEDQLLDRLQTETNQRLLVWAGMALLYLKTEHTTPLFDFIVQHENFGNTYLIPLFFQLRTDSLVNTAYNKIEHSDAKTKVLAAQILSQAEHSPKAERALKKAVQEWEINLKGYAIYSLREIEAGNLLTTLKPLLENTATRTIALEALANSPSKKDRAFFLGLFKSSTPPSKELLNALFSSKKVENTKLWLQFLVKKELPPKYIFSLYQHPTLFSDELLPIVQKTLAKMDDDDQKARLIRVLEGREDAASIDLLLQFLKVDNAYVRSSAARALKGTISPKIAAIVPELLYDSTRTTLELTDLAITNHIDTLHVYYEQLYAQYSRANMYSMHYLSTFPLPRHHTLFKQSLSNEGRTNHTERRYAALGLAKIQDKDAVELIYQAMALENQSSDFNVKMYLQALGYIKTPSSKKILEQYKDSQQESIRIMVRKMLADW